VGSVFFPTYWICVYANDQWDVQLGEMLVSCPFYEALHGALQTILMVDKAATTLERVWVVFEMKATLDSGQELHAWTPVGQIGHTVQSGPMAAALEHLKSNDAQASNPVDRRQIMNHIAGLPEMSGIQVAQAGESSSKGLCPPLAEDDYIIVSTINTSDGYGNLQPGTKVAVDEIDRSEEVLRGRLRNSDRWIPLKNSRTGECWAMKEEKPGDYVITTPTAVTSGISPIYSEVVATINSGEVINVSKVIHLPREKRVCGFLDKLGGYITIRDCHGFRWAIEGNHEDELAQTRPEKFEELNCFVQSLLRSGMQKSDSSNRFSGVCTIDDHARRGITLVQLRTLALNVKGMFPRNWSLARSEKDSLGMFAVRDRYLKPRIQEWDQKCECNRSYVEHIADRRYLDVQDPKYLISTARGTVFKDLMAALEWHVEARSLSEAVAYWSVIPTPRYDWSVSPEPKEYWQNPDERGEVRQETVLQVVANPSFMGLAAVFDSSAEVASRGWAVFEWIACFVNNKQFDMLCHSGALIMGHSCDCGEFDPEIAGKLVNFNVTHIHCNEVEDETRILNALVAGDTHTSNTEVPPESHEKFDKFNDQVRRVAIGPFLRQAALVGDLAGVQSCLDVCLGILQEDITGTFGERPVHLAAATGNVKMLTKLLEGQSDPNAADLNGETPLHYAAISGQSGSVELLLERRACLDVWSEFAETPLETAQANPAYFCSVHTHAVCEALAHHKESPQGCQLNGGCMYFSASYS